MKTFAEALVVMALASCRHAEQAPEQVATVHDQRQAALDRIADRCGLARSTFKLVGDRELTFAPASNAAFDDVECALTQLQKSNLPLKVGFVGNEYFPGNAQ